MESLEIAEIADSVTRHANRVKNAGNIYLYRKGLNTAKKIILKKSLQDASFLEIEFTEAIKKEYANKFPIGIITQPVLTNMDSDAYGDHDNNKNWSYANDTIVASQETEDRIDAIANDYNKATDNVLEITSGYRNEDDQAKAMFDNLENGKDLSQYKNQDAANEVLDVYNKGVEAGDSAEKIKEDMANIIRDQISNETFISGHLTDRAFDVRSKDMTSENIQSFKDAVKNNGGSVINEGDHLHVQFPAPIKVDDNFNKPSSNA